MTDPDIYQFDLRGLFWPDWLRDHWLAEGGSTVGITEPTVSQVLYALVVANKPTEGLPHLPYTVVETGIRYGASACWLAMACNAVGGRYYGIDIDKKCVDKVNQLFIEHDLRTCALAVEGRAPEKVVEMFGQVGEGCSIDLLFIDDDHAAAHVATEVKTLWPLIRPGGLMAFHDVIGGFPVWDIIKPLGAIKLVYQPFNQMGQAPFGGLGVLRKASD